MPRPADDGRTETPAAGPFPPEVATLIERCRAIAAAWHDAEEAAEEADAEAPPPDPADVRALLDLAKHPEALRAAFPPVTLADLIQTADDLRAWGFPPGEHVTNAGAPEAARLGDGACLARETGPGNRDRPQAITAAEAAEQRGLGPPP